MINPHDPDEPPMAAKYAAFNRYRPRTEVSTTQHAADWNEPDATIRPATTDQQPAVYGATQPARLVITETVAASRTQGDGPWTTAEAILAALDREGYTVMSKEDLHDIKHLRRGVCNYCGALIKPEKSGRPAPPGWDGKHWMSCRFYVGPLEHRWVRTGPNGTFGGTDYRCACGGWFRQGGLAGHGDGTEDAKPVCPNVSETYRGEQ